MQCKFKCNGRPIILFIFLVSILYAVDSCAFDVYHEDVQLKIWEVQQNGTPSLSVTIPPDDCVKEEQCPCTIQFQYHGYVAIFTREGSCYGTEDMELVNQEGRIGRAIHFHGLIGVQKYSKFSMCVIRGELHCRDIQLMDDRITWQYTNSTKTSNNSGDTNEKAESYRYTLRHVLGAAFGGAGTVGIVAIVLIVIQHRRFKQTEQRQPYETLKAHDSHHYSSLHITPAER